MRYEGVLKARTSVAVLVGVIIVVTGCGRLASHLGPSPVAEVTPSTAATASTAAASPASTTPSAAATIPAQQAPSSRPPPPPPPPASSRPSPSTRPSPPPLAIASVAFTTGEVGIAYPTVSLAASGGTPPYTWSIGSGALPGGLALSTSSISGMPSAVGPFQFTINVADSAGLTAGAPQSVTVVPPLTFSGSCTSLCSVEQGCVTVCGAYASIAGGLAPVQYTVSGVLPPGTTLNGPSLAGTFTTVSAAAPFSFSVAAIDALGAGAAVKANFNVFTHLAFTVTSASCFPTTAPGCTNQQLKYSGGTPGVDPKAVVSNVNAPNYKNVLPIGFSVITKGGVVYVSVPAQPNGTNWYGIITLSLVDQSPCGPGYNCASSNTAALTVRI